MDAILLAGGYGTRLRPLTYTRPKPLIPVAGRAMVDWVVDRLPPEVDHVIVAVNWLAPELRRHFAKGHRGIRFEVVQEAKPLGTAGAVKNCEDRIESDAFFVLNADIVSDMDLAAMLHPRKALQPAAVISLKEVAVAEVVNYGVVACGEVGGDGSWLEVNRFVEKPKHPKDAPSRLINAGAYLLDRRVLDLIPKDQQVSMEKEIFPQLIPKGFLGVPFKGAWIDVGDPVRLRQASRHLDPGYRLGPGSELGHDALFEDSVAGKGCWIGPGAQVKGCVLGDGVKVNPRVKLTDCVVGDGQTVTRSRTRGRIWTQAVPKGYPKTQVGNAL